jgi:aconitate decarboxylase
VPESSQGLTAALCRRVAACDDEIGDDALCAAKTIVLDGLAVAVAGAAEPAAQIVAAHVVEAGAAPAATLFGFGARSSPAQAAYVNGTAMHVLDFEPMWHPPTHPTSTTLPAVAALCERLGAGGREGLIALVKGFEIQSRLLLAGRQLSARDIAYHPPGVVGVMGAAVAAGHLLRLDATTLRHALGIAASRAGGLLANVGTMTKATHCGLAGALGVEAAQLAQRGLTANPDVLETGFLRTFFRELDAEALAAFGTPFRIVDPGVAIKRYPSQYGTHFCIVAGRTVHAAGVAADAVETVELRVPDLAYIDRPRLASGLDGKFSAQYTFAAALLDGDVTRATFADERAFRADAAALLPKIVLRRDPAISPEFPAMHVEATVRLRDGSVRRARCDGPDGLWGKPPIAADEHRRKIRDCFGARLAAAAIAEVEDLVAAFDTLAAAELNRLWALLA